MAWRFEEMSSEKMGLEMNLERWERNVSNLKVRSHFCKEGSANSIAWVQRSPNQLQRCHPNEKL